MFKQLQSVESYPLLSGAALDGIDELKYFRLTFIRLLLATVEMFTLRSVSQDASTFVSEANPFSLGEKFKIMLNVNGKTSFTEYATRLAEMETWGNRSHPIVLFKHFSWRKNEVLGVDILSLLPEFLLQYMNQMMIDTLAINGINFKRDWSKIETKMAVELLREFEGLPILDDEELSMLVDGGYILAVDIMLKMLAIQVF
jgi:hypothetical protein